MVMIPFCTHLSLWVLCMTMYFQPTHTHIYLDLAHTWNFSIWDADMGSRESILKYIVNPDPVILNWKRMVFWLILYKQKEKEEIKIHTYLE